MPNLYPLIRPALSRLPREMAHELSLRALETGLGRLVIGDAFGEDPPLLRQWIWGLDFRNPIGLAAGFDKDARVPGAMLRLGFGFVEVGTVTPHPQLGNAKPRLFRLDQDRAVINRMGFNSGGLGIVADRLSRRNRAGIVGANLGKNRDSADAVADYAEGIRRMAGLADYLVVNISSPNTPGLRDLQARTALDALLRRLIEARGRTASRTPLLLKIAPDLSAAECSDIAEVALETGIDGLIVANTTTRRPSGLVSRHAGESGGLSGRPLFTQSTAVLADIYRLTQGRLPLVGVGGIAGAADAYAKIRAGASLVQLYTALVFDGPALVGRIKEGLVDFLRRDGFASVGAAIGTAALDRGIPPLQRVSFE
ncbi:MAG TPA: quinone-dependent dihydroorotate dehydrogenase [Stellaceae bacterium]|jgi:dihydroorotate dehydrogenase